MIEFGDPIVAPTALTRVIDSVRSSSSIPSLVIIIDALASVTPGAKCTPDVISSTPGIGSLSNWIPVDIDYFVTLGVKVHEL